MNNVTLLTDDEFYLLESDSPAIILVIFSVANIFFLSLLFIYHLYLPSLGRTHLFLHFFLFFGLLMGSISNIIHVSLESTAVSLCYISLLIPLSYSIIYSSLLLNLFSFLHSLPLSYNCLLVFLCLLLQVSPSIQIIFLNPVSTCNQHNSLYPTPLADLLSFLPCCFLLLLATITSFRIQATFIRILLILSIVIWSVWVPTAALIEDHYRIIKGCSVCFFIFLELILGLAVELEAFLTQSLFLLPELRKINTTEAKERTLPASSYMGEEMTILLLLEGTILNIKYSSALYDS